MAENLDPGGAPVTVGNVSLITPGLTGVAQSHAPGTPGMRAAESPTETLDAALAAEELESQETVELTDTQELDAFATPTRSTSYDEPAIQVDVPAPGDEWGQVLLASDESGGLTWNFAVPTSDAPNLRAGAADADSTAVISGVYTKPGWKRLEEAEAEAAELKDRYQATPVTAKLDEVLRCIEGDPSTDVLHFSVHGQCDPSGIQDGLVLVDGKTLDPIVVMGTRFTSPRFVFLNAGMAAAFLYAGAAAVVAPLWSIDDKVARKLASDFYEAAFSGQSPADMLRSQRADFKRDSQPASSTCMAYQFFGHPDMHLVRS